MASMWQPDIFQAARQKGNPKDNPRLKQHAKFDRPFSSSHPWFFAAFSVLSSSSFFVPAPTAEWLRNGEPKACEQELKTDLVDKSQNEAFRLQSTLEIH